MNKLSIGIVTLVLLLVVMWLVSVARRRGGRSDRAGAMPTVLGTDSALAANITGSAGHHGHHHGGDCGASSAHGGHCDSGGGGSH